MDPGNRRLIRRLRRLAPNLLLTASALLLCFLALEVWIRLGIDLRREAPWPILDVDPEKRISFLPHRRRGYETRELRFTVVTNSHGRRDVEWSPAMLADPENILFIGDSLVFGYGVEDASTVPTRLEKRLAAAGAAREVFNFGMPGTSLPEYQLLLDDALRIGIEARAVVVGIFVGNDFYPQVLAPGETAAPRAKPPARRWRPRSELMTFLRLRVSHSPRLVGWALTAGRILDLNVYDTAGSWVFLRHRTPEQEAVFRRILAFTRELKRVSEENRRRLHLVIFPNKIQVENASELNDSIYDASKPNRQILEYCEEIRLPCLDLLPRLRAELARSPQAPLFFPIDRHLNPAGTEIVSREIAAFLLPGRQAEN